MLGFQPHLAARERRAIESVLPFIQLRVSRGTASGLARLGPVVDVRFLMPLKMSQSIASVHVAELCALHVEVQFGENCVGPPGPADLRKLIDHPR